MTATSNAKASGSDSLADAPLSSLIEQDARRRVCKGKVLLCIRLAEGDMACTEPPAPLYILASRVAYLPFFFDEAELHFGSSRTPQIGDADESQIWFDYKGEALKWHYPLGLLLDVHVGKDVPVPLDLTVHFQAPGPNEEKELLPFLNQADCQRVILAALRQAHFLQHGSDVAFRKLAKDDQMKLWDSMCECNLEKYFTAQEPLQLDSLSKCKSLAIRLHFKGPTHMQLLRPAPVFEDDGNPSLVKQYLAQVAPPLLTASGDALAAGVEVMAYGIKLPLETPLYWLLLHAAYFDQFIHLVVQAPAEIIMDAAVAAGSNTQETTVSASKGAVQRNDGYPSA